MGRSYRILLVASPVAPLGQGAAGGVTGLLKNSALALSAAGHRLRILAAEGSRTGDQRVDGLIEGVAGRPQPTDARLGVSDIYPIVRDGLIGHLWAESWRCQDGFDLIVNFGHDWLPYYLTGFFHVPVVHMVNLGHVNEVTSSEIRRVSATCPERVSFLSHSQARQIGVAGTSMVVAPGLDMQACSLQSAPTLPLVWAGRIAPEKGLDDALKIAARRGERLAVAGAVQDAPFWEGLCRRFGDRIDYRGHLEGMALQSFFGEGQVLLQTQHWEEAFGLVSIEAMACGTPVVAYDRGANSEIVKDDVSGRLVPYGDIEVAARAVEVCVRLDRASCRRYVDENFSLDAYGARLNGWLDKILELKNRE